MFQIIYIDWLWKLYMFLYIYIYIYIYIYELRYRSLERSTEGSVQYKNSTPSLDMKMLQIFYNIKPWKKHSAQIYMKVERAMQINSINYIKILWPNITLGGLWLLALQTSPHSLNSSLSQFFNYIFFLTKTLTFIHK